MGIYRMKTEGRTVNGRPVRSAVAFEEGGYWRWRITDARGNEFVDGGNHTRREEAIEGLKAALDPRELKTARQAARVE